MDICHLKKCGVRTQITEVQRQSRALVRHRKRRLWSLRSFTEQGSSASEMTAAKIMDVIARLPGCDGQAADAVSAYTQVNWRMLPKCSKFPNRNAQMFGYVFHDTNGQHHGQDWRSVVHLERNLYGHPLAWWQWERQFEEALLELGWEKVPNWEGYVRSLETSVISVRMCGWHQNGWKETEYGSHVEEIEEKCGYWRTHIISWLWKLGMHSAGMQTKRNNHSTAHKDVCITYFFSWINRKIASLGKASRENSSVVLRYGGIISKMLWTIMWIGKQESGATLQSFASLFGWSSSQTGGTGVSWRVVISLLTNCLEMLVIGKNWTNWHPVVREQAYKISHKMDSGMWQTISKVDFLFSSHKWLSTVLSCGEHRTALQIWVIPRLRLCWRPWGLKINLRRCHMYFGKSIFCPSQLFVQETNIGFARFYRSWNNFFRCWITYGWVTRSRSLGHCDWGFMNNRRQYSTHMSLENRSSTNWVKWITYPPTHVLLKVNLRCTSLKTTKLWSKW